MEKKEIKILTCGMTGSPKGKLTLNYILEFDNTLKRKVTITAPYLNWTTSGIWNKMKKVMTILINKSGHTTQMTRPEFINFRFEEFKNMCITDTIIFDNTCQK